MSTRELANRNRRRAEAVVVVLDAASDVVYAKDPVAEREAIQRLKAALDEADRLGVVYNRKGRPPQGG